MASVCECVDSVSTCATACVAACATACVAACVADDDTMVTSAADGSVVASMEAETAVDVDGVRIDDERDDESARFIPFYSTKPTSSRNRSVRKRKGVSAEEAADLPPAFQRSEWEGPFWFEAPRIITVTDPATGKHKPLHKGITSRERQRLREMLRTGFITEELLRTVVVPMNDETSNKARLRAHDHALTNCLKGKPRLKVVVHEDGTADLVDIFADYQRQLDKDHRLLLDPFRRGSRLFFEVDGKAHYTTAGQLTYIKFCTDFDVHAFVEEHEDSIRKEMKAIARSKPPAADGKRRRRRELTKKPSKYCRGAVFADYDILTDSHEEREAARTAHAALSALGNSVRTQTQTESQPEVPVVDAPVADAPVVDAPVPGTSLMNVSLTDASPVDAPEVSEPTAKRARMHDSIIAML